MLNQRAIRAVLQFPARLADAASPLLPVIVYVVVDAGDTLVDPGAGTPPIP